jgi:small subunit ribosomal protein S19
MAKFVYKGKSEEELKKMSTDEFMKLIPSRQRRSLKRGMTEIQKKVLAQIRENPKKFIKVRLRDMIIVPEMVGVKFGVYSGKEFVTLDIKVEMLGHRIGEFVNTRKQVKHSSPGFGATRSSKYVPLK